MFKFIIRGMGYQGRESVDSDVMRTEVMREFPYHEPKEVRFRYNDDYAVVHCAKYPATDLNCKVSTIPKYMEKDRLEFQMLLNPIDSYQGKKRPILKLADVSKWIVKKAMKNGFEIKTIDGLVKMGAITGKKIKNGKTELLTHNAVDVRGTLEVTDANLFYEALCSGVGPGKGYGFGVIEVL